MKTKIYSILLSILMFCTIAAPAVQASEKYECGDIEIARLSGASRYHTAIEIAKESAALLGKDRVGAVIIANGTNYADALAGVPLADYMNAPILLTSNKGTLEPDVLEQIKTLDTKSVFILGGSSAVNEDISNQLKDMELTVTRLSGPSRYDTAVEIARFNFDLFDVSKTVFLVSGENFPDALSAGAAAGITRANILFCPKSGEIKSAVADLIKNNGVKEVVIVGGTSAVGERAETELAALGVTTKRIYGANRYATSLAVYKEYVNVFDSSKLSFATGNNFPDALAGGALSSNLKAPVILVNNGKDNSAVTKAIDIKKIENVFIYGGESVVSADTVNKILKAGSSVTTTTTTQKPTTTTTKASTTTKTSVTTTMAKPTTTTTTTTAPTTATTAKPSAPGGWASQDEMNRILENVKSYAASKGMIWDSSLDDDTAFWATGTEVDTGAYRDAASYEARVKGKLDTFNRLYSYEYVNVKISNSTPGEYIMTCYFG